MPWPLRKGAWASTPGEGVKEVVGQGWDGRRSLEVPFSQRAVWVASRRLTRPSEGFSVL